MIFILISTLYLIYLSNVAKKGSQVDELEIYQVLKTIWAQSLVTLKKSCTSLNCNLITNSKKSNRSYRIY